MLNQSDIDQIVLDVLPNVKARVTAEIENRLVNETLEVLRQQIKTLVIAEFEQTLAKEIHAAIEGEKPVLVAELRKGLKEMGKVAGEAMVAQMAENLKRSWNVKQLVEAMLK